MTSVLPLTWRQKGLEKFSIGMDDILSRILNLNELQIIWYSVQTRLEHVLQSDQHSSSGQGLNHPRFHISKSMISLLSISDIAPMRQPQRTLTVLFIARTVPTGDPYWRGKKCNDHTLAHCRLSLNTTRCLYFFKSTDKQYKRTVLYWSGSFIYIRADSYKLCPSLPSAYYYQCGYRTVIHPSVQTSFLHHDYC